MSSSTSPLIEGNYIADNVARLGGGISIFGGNPVIYSNTFVNNLGEDDGGAVFQLSQAGHLTVAGNSFHENRAWDHGGAVYVASSGASSTASLSVQWNLFVSNTAGGNGVGDTGAGGGLHLIRIPGEVSFNTLVQNNAYGEGACDGSAISLDRAPADLMVRSNLIAFNDACAVSCRNEFARLWAGIFFGQIQTVTSGSTALETGRPIKF